MPKKNSVDNANDDSQGKSSEKKHLVNNKALAVFLVAIVLITGSYLILSSVSPKSTQNTSDPTTRPAPTPNPLAVNPKAACAMEPDPGLCRGAFPRFYFDQTTSTCKQFIWGGCEGVVPFDSLEECESLCQNVTE